MATLDPRAQTVAKVARKHLEGNMRFETVKAAPMTDHYGDDYFNVWVVYDSGTETLDPKFTISLYLSMKPDLLENGIDCEVRHSFIDRTEKRLWPELFQAGDSPESGG